MQKDQPDKQTLLQVLGNVVIIKNNILEIGE